MNKQGRLRKVLKDIRRLNQILGANSSCSGSAVAQFLLEIDNFINTENGLRSDKDENKVVAVVDEVEIENTHMQAKLTKVKTKLNKL